MAVAAAGMAASAADLDASALAGDALDDATVAHNRHAALKIVFDGFATYLFFCGCAHSRNHCSRQAHPPLMSFVIGMLKRDTA